LRTKEQGTHLTLHEHDDDNDDDDDDDGVKTHYFLKRRELLHRRYM